MKKILMLLAIVATITACEKSKYHSSGSGGSDTFITGLKLVHPNTEDRYIDSNGVIFEHRQIQINE
jgi:hypothetical protein